MIAIVFVVLIAFGNLRGVKESGKVFAVPTYFFIANMVVLHGRGRPTGHRPARLHAHAHPASRSGTGHHRHGRAAACCSGAALFVVLKAFASGGVGGHRRRGHLQRRHASSGDPEWRNARSTLV